MNNLLLAINYSRIFVGCFVFALIHELLNKSINLSKVFKFVFTLFNLQGTVRFPLSRSAFAFYHTQAGLSRTFFKFFQTFLRGFCCLLLAEQLRYVSTSSVICQALFSSSCKFLSDLLFFSAARRRLAYTSTPPPFCQALFHLFSAFFIVDFSDPQGAIPHLFPSGSSAFCEANLSSQGMVSNSILPDS